MKLKKGVIKRLHVSQPNIRANKKDGGHRPVLSISTSQGTFHADRVKISGPSELVYSPDKPISCGARVWIETLAEVEFDGDRAEPYIKPTIWTAAASSSPVLSQLDMNRPAPTAEEKAVAKARHEATKKRIAEQTKPFRRVRCVRY